YLMIEFQSSDDPWMAVRVMGYQALLYQDLIRHKQAGRPGDLPAVVAIVLYNGEDAWKAVQQIAELIGKVPDGLEPYLPRLRFILVDINRLKPWELKPADNLAVQLYRLERSRRLKKIERVLLGLFEELTRPGRSELLRAFLTWLRRVRMPRASRAWNCPL
ncbi:MAG: Rpn family recombination-promoting nuclease/putative transposase, partial [Acidobacteriota bacterium]